MSILTDLKLYLGDVRYLHKMLEWGQAWGLLIGFAALAISIGLLKDKKALICSCCLVFLSGMLTWPASELRSRPGPVDTERSAAINRQTLLRNKFAWAFYLEAGVMSVAILFTGRPGGFGKAVILLGGFGAFATASLAFWLQARELQVAYPILKTAG